MKKMLNLPSYLVLFSLSVLLLLPICAMAEGDGGWTTKTSPGYIFLIEEDLFNNQNHLVMTVLYPDLVGAEIHWGPASGSVDSTFLLESMNGESDMKATWQFNSVTEATVTVESCSSNCLWQSGDIVTLKKVFGDNQESKTGQRYGGCNCTGTLHETRWCDNEDGTVTDLTTCLVWLKDASWGGEYVYWAQTWNGTNAHARAAQLWEGSPKGGANLNLSDGSVEGDWRLPTKTELSGLVNGTPKLRCTTEPGPCDLYGFVGVQWALYWTGTRRTSDPYKAWFVSMRTGRVKYIIKWGAAYVWPVRSGN